MQLSKTIPQPRLVNLFIGFIFLFLNLSLSAQDQTTIRGKVYDAKTKEPLSFVDVGFKNTFVGVSTDLDGQYLIKTKNPSDSLYASFLGYTTVYKSIVKEDRQVIDFYLAEEGVVADAVTITGKKGKYKKKGNPAVELYQKVIANKDRNRMESKDYYNYDKHEKIELDLNNITQEFKDRRQFKKFDFLWNYLDTSEVNGRAYLPLYMREILSDVHYRKDPEAEKEIRQAVKMTKFDDAIDIETINGVVDLLYQDVDIYDNSINLLDNDFLSPLAPWGINYYRYYILDTTSVNNQSAIRLAFIPRNKTFIGFTGDLYISNDDKYSVLRVDLGITKDISLNFVRDLKIVQEFDEADGVYILKKDNMTLDLSLSKGALGMYATRKNIYSNHTYTESPDQKVYEGVEKMTQADDAYEKSPDYWAGKRIEPLTDKELGIYNMIDTLVTVPAYKRFVLATKILTTGYIPAGPVDIGDLGAFVAKNDVEGWRLRFGGETSHSLSQKWQIEGYGAYGFLDNTFKYEGAFTYSFNDDWRKNPKKFLKATYTHDVIFPGLQLEFIEADNFLTSFRRGQANQMLFLDKYSLEYFTDLDIGFFKAEIDKMNRKPYGSMKFLAERNGETLTIPDVNTLEFSFAGEYSPNATFLQGRKSRVPVIDNVPRFQFSYTGGFKAFGGDYAYHKLSLIAKKRIPLSVIGRSLTEAEVGGVIADDLPYILLYIPRANQSYSFQPNSFNTMNFLEFAADKYIRFSWQHFFDGYLINRLPLIRKLNLKEILTAKVIWGSLSDKHDPSQRPELIQYNINENGDPFTYALQGHKPYVEYGIGLYNIFKVIRLDLVKRANYLDHPNIEKLWGVDGLGARIRLKIEF